LLNGKISAGIKGWLSVCQTKKGQVSFSNLQWKKHKAFSFYIRLVSIDQMPAEDPVDERGDRRTGFEANSEARKGDGILGRLKPKKKQARLPPDLPSGSNWTLNDLANEMQMLGLEPSGLGRFIVSLHKLAVASGVNPSILASIIKDLSTLSEGKQVPIEKLRLKIQALASEQNELAKSVSELQGRKAKLEAELADQDKEGYAESKSLSEYHALLKRLQEVGVSSDELGKLSSIVASARQLGYDSSSIIGILEDLKSAREKKTSTDAQVEQALDSKRIAQNRLLALEQEIADKEKLLRAADELSGLGFTPKDLSDLSAAIRMIAKTRNLDEASAKERLITDLQGYYANDQELKNRLRSLESLLREKEDKFNLLESDFQNEKAVLDSASKLISSGLNEKWLANLRTVIDSYGTDIDSLANELRTRSGLNANIEELVKKKKALEEEERLLRQKVVAAEDQRIKTLSMINDLIVHTPREAPPTEKQFDAVRRAAASSENPEFWISAQKTVELIRAKLPHNSPARLVLEHALLALKLESARKG
jgi:hypothetical protein